MVDERRAKVAFDAVVPFRVSQRVALERVRTHLESRRWALKAVRQLRVHPRGLRGVLVPHWVYTGVIRSSYRARVGLHWYRTERYRDAEGKTRARQVRETEWQRLRGTAIRQVEDHLESASVGLPAEEARALGDFDLGWKQSYDPRLLSGFEAELPSVASQAAERSALDALREAEARRIQAQLLPGDVNRVDSIDSELELGRRRMLLLPVWIASYRVDDRVLRLLVHGQTGAVVGRVPLSRQAIALLILGLALVVVVAMLLWWFAGPQLEAFA